ncbi:transcription-repair coupling factor [Sanyastnella coralliicola]|uniref:transcription-repair coupling factor n=1 Tax=Sanyastnella coralliicola TaxID=3069118 RepID=UPI0027BA75A0|nr:transcription-repair coupling factor [Longitalea sp. SCSIO 12813]
MTLQEFQQIYTSDPVSKHIGDLLSHPESKVMIKGAVGSSRAMIAAAVIEDIKGDHLFILNDKESAAYFFNDLEHLLPDRKILFYPRSARVPYQSESTENANIAMRAEVLNEIRKFKGRTITVSFPEALAEQVVTKKNLSEHTFDIHLEESYSMEFIDEVMQEYAFEKVDYVYEPGQYSIRGGIVDIFSYSFDQPYRIEFFGDDVDSIRKFDPTTQLSTGKMTKATIVPNVGKQLLQESRESFFEFFGNDGVVWADNFAKCEDELKKTLEKAHHHYEKLESLLNHLKPEDLFTDPSVFKKLVSSLKTAEFGGANYFAESVMLEYDMTPQPSFNKNFELLGKNLRQNHASGYINVVTAGQPKQIERLYDIFEDRQEEVEFKPISIELSEGFIDKGRKILCYTDHQIFERYHRFRLKEGFRKNKEALTLKELSNLEPGDYVVHIDHGVGEFSGLQKVDVNGKEQEAIRLTYKGGDILYVSIHSLHRISKYSGKEGTVPKIDKLGSPAWQNKKNKTKKRVKELAFDLLKLYAKRKASKGFAYSPDGYLQNELEASFMYEDTPDQLAATTAVKEDMQGEYPMDRLVCGDVGFGKTEVAIRAAFKAACDGKQVAVLVPTTILSLQHYKSFKARLKEFPVTVDYLNRFKTGKKLRETLDNIESGKVDIVVGTHKIVGKQVKFKDLGLLVIDEEQKFGVSVKDKLKTMRANVDTLTLTATPIPRTLQFSLLGARDLSIINTPPPNRHPVETVLHGFNEEIIRDAISYEIQRGGQAYFVHNRVSNIKEVAGMIQRLVPDARVGIGHGQMNGDELEEVMTNFIDGTFDVLVATTIVESGIDISNANTMIINEAQNFGLSDLHQLRGRVGRSNKKAFCYLLAPPLHALPDESRKRLQAIEQFSDLGSGMNIAMRDLDIRGAGNMLGGEQSGFISDIGFDMYQKILDEAVRELKEEEFKDLFDEEQMKTQKFVAETALETDFELLIPDDYVTGIAERIQLYRELDETPNDDELDRFKKELVDRFGPIPKETEDLLESIKVRRMANDIGFEKLILKSGKMIGHFVSNQESAYYQSNKFSNVLEFLKHHPNRGKMYEKNGVLRMSFMNVERIDQAMEILRLLDGQKVGA